MRYVALLFAALCLLTPLTAGVGAATHAFGPADTGVDAGTDADAVGGASALATASFGEPRTEFVVSVSADRSARWNVTATFPFETPADRAAFEAYAAEFEAGEAVGGPSVEVFRNAARVAENATGREMAIRNVNRSAFLVNETAGVLRLTFTWTGFVGEEGGQLVLADVFRTAENTTWFRQLQSSQRLVIAPPPGSTVSDVPVGYQIRNGRAVLTGPATLDTSDLAIRFEAGAATPPPTDDWSTGETAAVVLLGGVVLGAAAALLYRRSGELPAPVASGGEDDTQPTDGGAVASPESNGSEPSLAETGTGTEAPTDEEVELLSDEERVERLLDRNGGRMRQAAIVQETGWSDAKVSQLLSSMADEGRVEKLRLGRENLISLPGEDGEEPRQEE